ncbi:MAG: hypothetical protein ACOXZ0_08430 [Eubacteriales bacterium]|jgi:hypothetical protein
MTLKRTEKEDALSSSFYQKNYNRLNDLEQIIVNNNIAAIESYIVSEKISYYQNALAAINELRKLCNATTGGRIYLEDMWEHCHNNKNPDFDFLKQIEEAYSDILNNPEKYESEEITAKKIVAFQATATNEIMEKLRANPNILQKEFYKLFDNDLKDVVSKELYYLSKSGLISRKKQGSTYILNITQ